MKRLPAFIPEVLVKATGWTLIHSLWQGALLGLALALLLVILHRSSAAIRYTVSAVAMLTFLLLTTSTFISQYKAFTYSTATSAGSEFSAIHATGFPVDLAGNNADHTMQQDWLFSPDFLLVPYFNQHLPVVVLVWTMGIIVLLLRFIGGMAYIRRLKNYKNTPLPTIWQDRLQSLAQQLHINQPVRLVESALVKVPMVIGYFKPVILLPLGVATGLPVQQLEAVLAHELAHIHRKDYLINLMQSLMEILFFYHPCIWWISACMREEREHCCDDIALSVCADSLTFAKALTNLQTINGTSHQLALAITGKSNSLLYRIQRLLNRPKQQPNFFEGFIAALFLMLSLLAVSVSARATFYRSSETMSDLFSKASYNLADQNTENNQVDPVLLQAGDSTRTSGKRTISFNGIRDNKNYDVKMVMNADTISELYIDGKQIPPGKVMEYRDLIDELTSDLLVAPPEPMEPFEPIDITEEAEPLEPIEPIEAEEPAEPIEPIEIDHLEKIEPVEPVGMSFVEFWHDTTRMKGKTTITFDGKKDGKKINYKIRMEDGLVKELHVDGKRIPDDKISAHSDLIDKYTKDNEVRYEENMFRLEEVRRQQEEIRRQHGEMGKKREEMRQQQEEMRERMLIEQEQFRKESDSKRRKMTEEHNQKREFAMIEREKAMQARADAMVKRDKAITKRNELVDILQKELARDKLIQNKNKFEFKLNSGGLYIDGLEQPASVFEKYKKIVEKHNGKTAENSNFNMEIKINREGN